MGPALEGVTLEGHAHQQFQEGVVSVTGGLEQALRK